MFKKLIYLKDHLSKIHRINRTFTSLIDSSHVNDDCSYIKLSNGKLFTGQPTKKHFRRLYFLLKKSIRSKVPPELMQVLIDIDFRYMGRNTNKSNLKEGKYYELQEGDVVFEVGAYIGYHAMRLSELVGNSGKVIAIEAIPANYAILKKNIELNNLKNIIPINMAIWKNSGVISMNLNEHQKNSISEEIVQTKKKEELPCNTIDNIIDELNLTKVDFIRLQINGAELEALEGMRKIIESKPKILAAVPYKNKDEIVELLKNKGYNTKYTGHSIFAQC